MCKFSMNQFKLSILDLFFTKWTFSCCPLESLDDGTLDLFQPVFVYLRFEWVVDQHIWTRISRTKCPDWTCSKFIPVKLIDQYISKNRSFVWLEQHTVLNAIGKTFIQRLCYHKDFVFLVRSLSKALDWWSFEYCFANWYKRLTDFDFNLSINLTQIVNNLIHVELACSDDYVFTRLFDFRCGKWITLINFSQTFNHFGEFTWV